MTTQNFLEMTFIALVKIEVIETGCTIEQAKANVKEYMNSEKFANSIRKFSNK